MKLVMKIAITLAMTFYIVIAVPAFVLSGLLLVYGETSQGQIFAIAAIIGLSVPITLWIATKKQQKRVTLKVSAYLSVLTLILLGINYTHSPDGQPLLGSSVSSKFMGEADYQRASIANLVPEMDQLLLGTYIIPALDPRMNKTNTLELRTQVREVYSEMSHSGEFDCLGSVMNQSYKDILIGHPEIGHFYEYIPKQVSRERMPVVIFLHGSLGNFKGFLWVWKRIADAQGIAIVAPTFGAGKWNTHDGEVAIELARRYCVANPRFDPDRIFLAGLSNGGRGVCLGAQRSPNTYQGLIFISPVLDTKLLLTDNFVKTWKDKPILILHGTSDNRIPIDYIDEAVDAMKGVGMQVESQIYEGQTHFLFFTFRKQIQERIGRWLTMAEENSLPAKPTSSDSGSQPSTSSDGKPAP